MASVWDTIETTPEAAAALSWRRWLGPAFDAVAAVCLRETGGLVKRIPCGCGCACNHRVRKRDKGLVGVCDCGEECQDVPLTEADVKVWEVDLAKLGRAVARALGCGATVKPMGFHRTTQVTALGNPALPVILAVQPDVENYRCAAAHIIARLPKGSILLTATRLVDASTLELLTKANVGFYDLESLFTLLPSGKLHSPKTAEVLFAAHLPEKQVAVKESEAARVFAILERLRSKRAGMSAPPYDVLIAIVLDGLSQRRAATQCDCSLGQISKRVKELEKEFGLPLKQLQNQLKPMLEMQTSVKGERRRKRKPGSGPGAFADDKPNEDEDDTLPAEEYRYEESGKDD